jgi:hypothetical protein
LGLLDGLDGRGVVVCELTIRLHRSPWSAWAHAELGATRPGVLALMSAARALLASRHVDTLQLHEAGGRMAVAVRVSSHRDAHDLGNLTQAVSARLAELEAPLCAFAAEDRRVRLGQQPPHWPQPRPAMPMLELQVAWPDIPALLDVTDALAGQANLLPDRAWSVGADAVRLRVPAHGAVQHVGLLLDAGAVPIAVSAQWRQAVRERMSPASKVVLTSLHRAFDPDGLISAKSGLP